MRILITGFSGFVSQHFVAFLSTLNKNIAIAGIYHKNLPRFNTSGYKNLDIKLYQADLTVEAALDPILLEFSPTHILHLAAKSSVADSWKNPDKCILQNTSLFLYLVESVRRTQLQPKILSVGSAEEYGKPEAKYQGIHIPESFPLNPISPYAVARQIQHSVVKIYSHHYGLHIVHTRSFNHFGAYQLDKFVIPSFAKQITEQYVQGNKTIHITVGDIDVVRDFTDVRDVARAYYLLLTQASSGKVYNVCRGIGYKLSTLIDKMADLLGVEIVYTLNPDFLRPSENKLLIGDNTKLKADTGWEAHYDIDQSLLDLLDYWKSRHVEKN